jgi:hypothetical protein
MLRTRNLAIVATFVSAGALGAAVALFDTSLFGTSQLAALGLAVSDEEQTFTASLPEVSEDFAYDDRVRELRKKIADSPLTEYQEVTPEPTVGTTTEEGSEGETEEATSETEVLAEKRCSLYQVSNTPWDAREISMQVSEGARIFYRAGATATVGSTTTAAKEILARLPLRSSATGSYCIPSDVIGITENGYLIYNNDVALFASYGSNTLIGYALDGLPIYGPSTVETDECGGARVGGSYRYILNTNRDTIIACYAATPIAL